jgi:hypothetical protein
MHKNLGSHSSRTSAPIYFANDLAPVRNKRISNREHIKLIEKLADRAIQSCQFLFTHTLSFTRTCQRAAYWTDMAATSQFWARESFGKAAPHHASIQALWEGKWRAPVRLEPGTLYPPYGMRIIGWNTLPLLSIDWLIMLISYWLAFDAVCRTFWSTVRCIY